MKNTPSFRPRYLFLLFALITLEVSAQDFSPYPERYRRLVQSISFSPDGNTLYFSLMQQEYLEALGKPVTPETPVLAIYRAQKSGNSWGEPVMLPFSGKYKDYEPTISPDGQFIFFNSNRPLTGNEPLKRNNIWFSQMRNGAWQEPQHMPAISREELEESYPTLTKDGYLFYMAARPDVDGVSNAAIYRTKFEGAATKFGEKVQVIDQPPGTGDPWVAPDESYLIFTKFDNDRWRETCDLYISFKEERTWSKPILMADLNTDGADFAVAISPDEQWIYYRKNYRFIKLPFQPILERLR